MKSIPLGAYVISRPAIDDDCEWMNGLEIRQTKALRELSEAWVQKYFGPKCPDFDPNCEACQRWLALERLFGDV